MEIYFWKKIIRLAKNYVLMVKQSNTTNQHFHNKFTTNFRLKVVIGSHMNLLQSSFFYLSSIT